MGLTLEFGGHFMERDLSPRNFGRYEILLEAMVGCCLKIGCLFVNKIKAKVCKGFVQFYDSSSFSYVYQLFKL